MKLINFQPFPGLRKDIQRLSTTTESSQI